MKEWHGLSVIRQCCTQFDSEEQNQKNHYIVQLHFYGYADCVLQKVIRAAKQMREAKHEEEVFLS